MKKGLFLSLLVVAAISFYTRSFWVAFFVLGFFFGFLYAISCVYKRVTGKSLEDKAFGEILEKLF